jgi:acetamidase/formamidase
MLLKVTEVRSRSYCSADDAHHVPEVCGTAIETPMRVSVQLTVLNGHSHVESPHFTTVMTPLHSSSTTLGESYYTTTGVGSSILDATKDAVRGMIKTLGVQHGLSRVEAYMLCSVAGDLRLHEVVSKIHVLLVNMLIQPQLY